MDIFWKTAAGILTALILWINLSKENKDISVLMTMAVCAMAVIASVVFLRPIMDFMHKLQLLVHLDNDLLSVVLKVVGIGIVTEIVTLVCKDVGNEAMGKALQFLSATAALCLSVPVFEKLFSLLERILGAV